MVLVTVSGTICADSLKQIETKDGTAMAVFRVGASTSKKNAEGKNEPLYKNCKVFGKSAENLLKAGEGTRIICYGQEEPDNYTDNEGAKHYRTIVNVGHWEYAERKGDTAQAQPQAQGYMNPPTASAPQFNSPTSAPQYGTPAPAPQFGNPAPAPQFGNPAPAPAPQFNNPTPAPAPQFGNQQYNANGFNGFTPVPAGMDMPEGFA